MSRNKAVLQGQLQHENMQKGNRTGRTRGVFGHGQNSRGNAGFSLLEILAALAIMVILFAVGIVAVGQLHTQLTQTKLDKTAEQIYIAAQNQMTELYAAGDIAKLAESAIDTITTAPSDWDVSVNGTYAGNLRFVNHVKDTVIANPTQLVAANALLPETAISQDTHNNNWLVEYDPMTGYVYSVFYSETAGEDLATARNTAALRNGRSARIAYYKAGNDPIGYYGGGTIVATAVLSLSGVYDNLTAEVQVHNLETLTADLFVHMPAGVTNPNLVLTVTGASSGATATVLNHTDLTLWNNPGSNMYTYTVNLDSLAIGQQFKDICTSLHPGENITVTLTATGDQTQTLAGETVTEHLQDTDSVDTNSLFENYDVTNQTASIRYGRHLQNLDVATSGLAVTVVKGEQWSAIDFTNTDGEPAESWKATYGTSSFTSVINTDLASYDGHGNLLANMTIAPNGANNGLFGTLGAGATLQNIHMVNTLLTGNANNAGALAGTVNGDVTVNHCRVYLRSYTDEGESHDLNADKSLDEKNPQNLQWIVGDSNVGGFAGRVTGAMNVDHSFVSTVIASANNAGGFAGSVADAVKVEHSYADNYIGGNSVGGFAAVAGSGSTFTRCYVAGFAMDTTKATVTKVAGFAPATGATINGGYSVLDANNYTSAVNVANSYALVSGGSVINAYSLTEMANAYNHVGETQMNDAQMRSLSIGGFVAKNTDTTAPYNVGPVNDLDAYPYPGLSLKHYGDWAIVTNIPAELVYYEKYTDGSYGFFSRASAGNKLLNKEIEQEGYALLFRTVAEDGTADISYRQDTYIRFNKADFFAESYNPLTADMTDASARYKVAGVTNPSGLPTVTGKGSESFILRILPVAESTGNDNCFAGINTVAGIHGTTPEDSKYFLPLTIQVSDASGNPPEVHAYYFNPHFANGVAADKILDSAVGADNSFVAPAKASRVTIRTPRQLYLLSRYYPAYRTATNKATFNQELDINYSGSYNWTDMVDGDAITAAYAAETHKTQDAIGYILPSGKDYSFAGNYVGGYHTVTGVSIVAGQNLPDSESHYYAGLFGALTGEVRNLAFVNDYKNERDAFNYSITYKKAPQRNGDTAYMGALVGYNNGRINNCAVAGFTERGFAYNYSMLYLGGLVGMNNGYVYNSGADMPGILVQATSARATAGAFAGENNRTIEDSYALGTIEGNQYQGATLLASGFCGANNRDINNCYSAVAMTLEGVEGDTQAFANGNGNVKNSFYLNNGAYYYISGIRSFSYPQDKLTGTTEHTDSQLKALLTDGAWKNNSHFGAVAAENTFCNSATEITSPKDEEGNPTEVAYPYPSAVTNARGDAVHYGNWTYNNDLGEMGFLYWEHEEGGSNEGYHFYALSTNGQKNTTLCEAHDDGGVVTEYGYGYYVATTVENPPTVYWGDNLSDSTKWRENTAANEELKKHFSYLGAEDTEGSEETIVYNYEFHCFNTTGAFAGTPDDTKMYLKEVDEPKVTVDRNTAVSYKTTSGNRAMTVNAMMAMRKEAGAEPVYYSFNPFFGASMEMATKQGATVKPVELGDTTRYEIRSIDQLQFLNWNYSTSNTSQLVSSANYQHFPYLMSASITGQGTQTKSDAGNNITRFWQQTHDIDLSTVGSGVNFTPIAGMSNTSQAKSYRTTLYAWFGGHYDGQSYKIEELSINSDAFSIGLFGVTSGATIENMIMYSEHNAVIARKATSLNPQDDGAYALGGLIGVAYDYSGATGNEITNCAIAGYKIQDNSSNRQTLGEANVGGLIGIAKVNLNKCSSAVDIEINCTHTLPNGDMYLGNYGNFVRVGGLVGGSIGTITDCYTGGSIRVGQDTLMETFRDPAWGGATRTAYATQGNGSTTKKGWGGYQPTPISTETVGLYYNATNCFAAERGSTNIYVGGVLGGSYGMNFYNYTNKDNELDGSPVITNCYTYTDLPKLEGTIRSVAVIGSLGDRFFKDNTVTTITLKNCYYLGSIVEDIAKYAPNYNYYYKDSGRDDNNRTTWTEGGYDGWWYTHINSKVELNRKITTTADAYYPYKNQPYVQSMLNGDGIYLSKVYDNIGGISNAGVTGHSNYSAASEAPKALTYAQLQTWAGQMGTSWDYVTVTEGGAPIDGKYSFPGEDKELLGQNYLFPTVITQPDKIFNRTVNVHYGAWPKNGLYTDKNAVALDLLARPYIVDADGKLQPAAASDGVKEYMTSAKVRLYESDKVTAMEASQLQITYGDDRKAESTVAKATVTGTNSDEKGSYVNLLVQGLREGAETVYVTYNGYTTRINVTVTAENEIDAVRLETVDTPDVEIDEKAPMSGGDTRSWILTISDHNGLDITNNVKKWNISVDNPNAISNDFTVEKDAEDRYVLTVKALPVEEIIETLIRVAATVEVQDERNLAYQYNNDGTIVTDENGVKLTEGVYCVETRTQALEVAVEPPKVSSITFHVLDVEPVVEGTSNTNVYRVMNLLNVVKAEDGTLHYQTLNEYISSLTEEGHLTLQNVIDGTDILLNDSKVSTRVFKGWYVTSGAGEVDLLKPKAMIYENVDNLANNLQIVGEMHAYAIWDCKTVALMAGDENIGYAQVGKVYITGTTADNVKAYADYNLTAAITTVPVPTDKVGYVFGQSTATYSAGYEYTPAGGKYGFTKAPIGDATTVELDQPTMAMVPDGSQVFSVWSPKQYTMAMHPNYPAGATVNEPVWSDHREDTLTYDAPFEPFTSSPYYKPASTLNGVPTALEGWFTGKTDGNKVLEADGTLVAGGYVDAEKGSITNEKWQYDDNLNLYAHWRIGIALWLNANYDGSGENQLFMADNINGKNILTGYSSAPSREGYKLNGWYTDAAAGDKVLNADSSVAGNVTGITQGGNFNLANTTTLYAQWAKEYQIIFDKGETNLATDASMKVTSGYAVNNTAPIVTHATNNLATFKGWQTADGKVLFNENGVAQNVAGYIVNGNWVYEGNVTLQAKWNTTCYVTFSAPNANKISQKFEIANGTAPIILTSMRTVDGTTGVIPTRNKYRLVGWNYNGKKVLTPDGTWYADEQGLLSNGVWQFADKNVTLTADFRDNVSLIRLHASKADNWSNSPVEIFVTINSTALDNITVPTRAGWEFDGWYTRNSNGNRVINADGTFANNVNGYTNKNNQWTRTNDAELYARWKRTEVTKVTSRTGASNSSGLESDAQYIITNGAGQHLALDGNSVTSKAITVLTDGNKLVLLDADNVTKWTHSSPTNNKRLNSDKNYLTLDASGNLSTVTTTNVRNNWGIGTDGTSLFRYIDNASGNRYVTWVNGNFTGTTTNNEASATPLVLYKYTGEVYEYD